MLRDRAGASAVEFSLIVVPFLFFIGVLFQTLILGIEQASLDNAAIQAIRLVNTGNVQGQGYTASNFGTNVVCPLLLSTMSCSNLAFNVTNTGGFMGDAAASASMSRTPPAPGSGTYCPGSGSSYIFLQLYYTSPFTLLNLSSIYGGSNSSQVLTSTSIGMNEPFSGVAGSC